MLVANYESYLNNARSDLNNTKHENGKSFSDGLAWNSRIQSLGLIIQSGDIHLWRTAAENDAARDVARKENISRCSVGS